MNRKSSFLDKIFKMNWNFESKIHSLDWISMIVTRTKRTFNNISTGVSIDNIAHISISFLQVADIIVKYHKCDNSVSCSEIVH